MQTTNAAYQALLAVNHRVEYKTVIAGVTYGMNDKLSIPKISSGLFDQFGVGNAVVGSLDISLVPSGVIPPMSLVEVYFRLTNGTSSSDWYPKGKFYIDVRKINKDGVINLECYDAMLKAEYTFMESGSWTSTTALATLQMIASDMGVSIEAGTTTLLTNDSKMVPNVPLIGENGTTGREMLKYIAAMYGGNFIIDEEGSLKLVQLVVPDDTHTIGVKTTSLDTATAFDAIDRVILRSDDETGYRSPDVPDATWDAMTGRVLEAMCPWTSQALADGLLTIVSGYVYQPFDSIGVDIDPAMQLGDGVDINNVVSAIYKATLRLDARCAADLSAPYDKEVNHEYPYRSPAQRRADDSVTKQELKTAGQTIINGSNIRTGTIVCGGNNNENGTLEIHDASDVKKAEMDNSGLTIWDDTTYANSQTGNATLKILRVGDQKNSHHGIFEGVTSIPGGASTKYPFINLRMTDSNGDDGGSSKITADSFGLERSLWNPAETVQTIDRANIYPYGVNLFQSIFDNTTPPGEIITYRSEINPRVMDWIDNGDASVSKTSGKWNCYIPRLHVWGNIAQFNLIMMVPNGTDSSPGDNVFVGKLNVGNRPWLPASYAMGVGYIGSSTYVMLLEYNGTITVRLTGAAVSNWSGNGWPAYCSTMYIFQDSTKQVLGE